MVYHLREDGHASVADVRTVQAEEEGAKSMKSEKLKEKIAKAKQKIKTKTRKESK